MIIKIYLRMNINVNATLLHALMRLVDRIAGNIRELKLWYGFCALDGPTKGCLLKQPMEHLLGIGAALLRQHRLNATCSNPLSTPLKPHAHTLMYKSAAASFSIHEKQLQKNPAKEFCILLARARNCTNTLTGNALPQPFETL